MPPWAELLAGAGPVERWLLPGECLLCQGPTHREPADPLICAPCRTRWTPLPALQCGRCGQPLSPGIDCRLCTGWPASLLEVRSAVWLDTGARHAVHLLKYGGWWRVAESLALGMRRHLVFPAGSTLVPVPLGATRQRTRGYNQSAALAIALGKLLGIPVTLDALRRRRETTTQTLLTPEERRANLSGAFQPAGRVPDAPMLVDDVFTTGATLSEAAVALAAGGAREVRAVTFARAERPLAAAVRAGISHEHTF